MSSIFCVVLSLYSPVVDFHLFGEDLENWCSFIFRFLDILAARKDPAGLSGEVLIDGASQPPNFKCLSGYVVQVHFYFFISWKTLTALI